jgi:predicted AlkP superfamily phosphohydrolase/phosphomutase
MARKVMVIGLDGGSWTILHPLMEEGLMPTLKRLVDEGVSGPLQSVVPPITPVAWTSFMTGANPGKHGVFGFTRYDRTTGQLVFSDTSQIQVDTVWQVASRSKHVVCLNLPMTFPPLPVNGVMVSGLMTPSPQMPYTYPRALKEELVREVGYELPIADHRYAPLADFEGTMRWLESTIDNAVRATTYVAQRFPWDVLASHFQSVDYLQHPFWCYVEPSHPSYDVKKHARIKQFFAKLDHAIEQLLSLVDQETITIVMSDHGFRANNTTFNLNAWLRSEGYLHLAHTERRRRLIDALSDAILRIDRRGRLHSFLRARFAPKVRAQLGKARVYFDPSASRAYADLTKIYGMIHFTNQADPSLADEISAKLLALTDPRTGKPVIKQVHRKHDLYQGDALDIAPDLVVHPHDEYSVSASVKPNEPILTPTEVGRELHVGTHDLPGVFAVHGADVRSAHTMEASIIDLAPTILAVLGLAIPEYMDGRVLREAFSVDLSGAQRIEPAPSDSASYAPTSDEGYTEEEEEAMKAVLKNLGYLD